MNPSTHSMQQYKARAGIIAGILLLALAFSPAYGQQYIQIADRQPAIAKQSEYYIIKLKYLSIEQVAAYFKAGGLYAKEIPPTVESIAGIPSLQSIALKTTNPQDILTMTRLIAQLDHPARSYNITCTVVLADGAVPPVLPENYAVLPGEEIWSRLHALVKKQQASVIMYPNLHIDLNEHAEIIPQESSPFYQLSRDAVTLPPTVLFPEAPVFRLSHLPAAVNAPTTGAFGMLSPPAEGIADSGYTLEKLILNDTIEFAYTGIVPAADGAKYRMYMVVAVRAL